MADKPENRTARCLEGNNNTGTMRMSMRKLSFIRTFSSNKNDPTSPPNSPSVVNSTTEYTAQKTGSPKHRKSHGSRESTGSTSDIEELEVLKELQVSVQYLGKIEMRSPGYSEICETVNSTYHRAKPYLKNIDKSTLVFNENGITIKHEPSTRKNTFSPYEHLEGATMSIPETETLYKARRILYCAVDKTHQRVFFFNYQYGSRAENVQMHVIVCKKDKEAKELAKRCSLLFKKIQKDLHRRDKERREDHMQGLQKIRSRSSIQSLQSPVSGSKEGSCSGTCGSGEWLQERVGLSMA